MGRRRICWSWAPTAIPAPRNSCWAAPPSTCWRVQAAPSFCRTGLQEPRAPADRICTMARDVLRGLTKTEVAQLLSEFGPNALPQASARGLARIILDTLREPMFLLLIGAASLYLVLGDLGEGLFLMAGALATIGLVVLQEARSERALSALRDLSQPHARVIRDGVEARLAARDLVPGDIVLVGEGERLPADGALVAGDVLSVDESALTGESAPVSKRPLTDGETADADTDPGA
ncbi:MAG: HAD-IC family P-type ATPase, partial [Gemmatimonadaceae bacterium]|nr:HAD-IC family P-type ATPase [Caulobacter sp.]